MKKSANRHFGKVVASQRGAQGSEFALPLHGQRDEGGAGQQRAGHRQALVRHARRQQWQAATRVGQVQACFQVGAGGEQRGGMAIVTHAQHQYIDWRQCEQSLVGLASSGIEVFCLLVQADKSGLGRRALEQVAGQQACVAVSVLYRHPALIGQADGDLGPVQVFTGQLLKEWHRATATRQHHAGLALGSNRCTKALGHIMGQRCSQHLGVRQVVNLYGCRQLQFRYPHTTPSHRV
ncbi:hypothetical protein D3C76_1172770 [compost metagenome]